MHARVGTSVSNGPVARSNGTRPVEPRVLCTTARSDCYCLDELLSNDQRALSVCADLSCDERYGALQQYRRTL